MKLIHYSAWPLRQIRNAKQDYGHADRGDKPNGLWFSAGDGEDGWRAWCEAESFGLKSLRCATEIILAKDADVLRLRGAADIDCFTRDYGIVPEWERSMRYPRKAIDWPAVAAKFDAIVIAPYCYARRLDGEASSWYHGWDCASGCVWNKEAVRETVALTCEAETQ